MDIYMPAAPLSQVISAIEYNLRISRRKSTFKIHIIQSTFISTYPHYYPATPFSCDVSEGIRVPALWTSLPTDMSEHGR